MKEISWLAPDYSWHKASLEEVSKELNNEVKVGWNESPTDTVLVIKNGDHYCVQVWNRPNIRAELIHAVSLPIHRL